MDELTKQEVASAAQAEHDEAVRWLRCLRLVGSKLESASPQFEATWERDRLALLDAIKRGEQSQGGTVEEIIQRAVLLTDVEYAQDRDWIADAADIRVSDLDKFVAEGRPKPQEVTAKNVAASILDIKPWPDPVDAVALLDEVAAILRRFIVFEHVHDADALAVWALGTHCFQIFSIFPRVAVTSPERMCGKTTVLDALNLLAARPQLCSNLTPAVVYRIVELARPTLLVDELDTFIAKYPELEGVFNSGHKKGAYVMRCEKIDDQQVVCKFATFAPLAFGMIGRPVGTLASRSLSIRMLRKDETQEVDTLDPDEQPEQAALFERLRCQLARWVLDNQAKISEQRPETNKLSNRTRDNWRPLLKITSVVGGGWLDKMYAASGETPSTTPEDDSDAVRLLRDVRDIFHTRGIDCLPSRVLVADLLCQRESGWQHHRREQYAIDERDLGKLLGHFNITSNNIRFKTEQLTLFKLDAKRTQLRGYHLEQFTPLFRKFLAGEEARDVETSC